MDPGSPKWEALKMRGRPLSCPERGWVGPAHSGPAYLILSAGSGWTNAVASASSVVDIDDFTHSIVAIMASEQEAERLDAEIALLKEQGMGSSR